MHGNLVPHQGPRLQFNGCGQVHGLISSFFSLIYSQENCYYRLCNVIALHLHSHDVLSRMLVFREVFAKMSEADLSSGSITIGMGLSTAQVNFEICTYIHPLFGKAG